MQRCNDLAHSPLSSPRKRRSSKLGAWYMDVRHSSEWCLLDARFRGHDTARVASVLQ
jgi:hypothetical protein